MENKEFKELQKENKKLREEIYLIINNYLASDERDDLMMKINTLIENELLQEEFCNQ